MAYLLHSDKAAGLLAVARRRRSPKRPNGKAPLLTRPRPKPAAQPTYTPVRPLPIKDPVAQPISGAPLGGGTMVKRLARKLVAQR